MDMRFVQILSDGKFHESVPEGTEGAVARAWESKDGTKSGTKHERVFGKLENVLITNIQFWDGEYGEQIQITFEKEGNEITLSQNAKGNFGESILKVLPSLDFTKTLSVQPYAFKDENSGKEKRGVSFWQNGDKVMDFFYDWEKKEPLHGYPSPKKPREEMKADDWTLFFTEARIVMVDYAKKEIVPKFPGRDFKPKEADPFAPISEVQKKADEESIDPSSIPF